MSVRFRSFSAHAFLKDNRSRRQCVHQVGKASIVLYQIIFLYNLSISQAPRITFPWVHVSMRRLEPFGLACLMPWPVGNSDSWLVQTSFTRPYAIHCHPLRFGEAQWPVLQFCKSKRPWTVTAYSDDTHWSYLVITRFCVDSEAPPVSLESSGLCQARSQLTTYDVRV